ncbi:MAG TPA: VOC family protein [bacterium]|nr:VOC family protein [bacterium]
MTAKVKPIPDGYHSVTPYLSIDGAAGAMEFYKKAFGAKELFRMPGPDGKVGHAEIQIGDSRVMLADENPEMEFRSPKSLGGTPVSLMIYVEDVDRVFQQALAAGARVLRPLKDQFYGDRSGNLQDPFGHKWTLSTHVEDVAPDEMERRMKEAMEAEAILD